MLNVVIMLCAKFIPQTLETLNYMALCPLGFGRFEIWQPLTYMFIHMDMGHLFFNMFALWMFGRQLEYDLGSKRFFLYYMLTGVGAAIIQLAVMYLANDPALVIGASGAVYGILLAFGMIHPNLPLYFIFIPVPVKAKYIVIGYGVLELLQGITVNDGVAHFAHLGGMIFGVLILLYWRGKRKIHF